MTTGLGPLGTVFLTPGAFTYNVPAGRSLVYVTMQAAGCGGNRGGAGPGNTGGGGGGGGEVCVRVPYVVTPGGTVSGSVGAGGMGGTSPEQRGATGGDSYFGLLRCNGAPDSTATHVYGAGDYGGGANGPGVGIANSVGIIGAPDGAGWYGGSSGGPDTSGGNLARIGGPAGGYYGAPANASSDRGGGGGAATIFAAGVSGADPAINGSDGVRGGGGAGGGGAGAGNGGTGGNGYVLIEVN